MVYNYKKKIISITYVVLSASVNSIPWALRETDCNGVNSSKVFSSSCSSLCFISRSKLGFSVDIRG